MEDLVIVNVPQGTEEWHALRMRNRPASMAPWITGRSRYATRKDAVNYFKGIRKEPSEWVEKMWAHGRAMEPIAATHLEEVLQVGGEPVVGVRGNLLASMDFYSYREQLGAEIKCPYQGLRSKTWQYAEQGEVDPAYVDQLEQQWRVFGLKRHGLFVYVDRSHFKWVEFQPSDDRWQNLLLCWEELDDIIATGRDPESQQELNDDPDVALALSYAELKQRIEQLTKNADEIKKQLEERAAGKTTKFGKVLTVRYEQRSGSIDYPTLVRELLPQVDVEAYRGDPTPYSKVVISKPEKPATEPAVPVKTPRKRGK